MATFKIGKIVLGSLFKKPATLMYPVIPRKWQERTRGQIGIEEEKCILCGICGRKCPTDAIKVNRGDRTWEIQRMQCIQCGCCVEVCPKKCLIMLPDYTEPGVEKIIDTHTVPEVKKPAPKTPPTEGKSAGSSGASESVDSKGSGQRPEL